VFERFGKNRQPIIERKFITIATTTDNGNQPAAVP